ncbi:flavoprotein-like protein [Dichotomocladium elegans]|nr:flavoprotein-like protein [Dichotomocladium elegans]
MPKVFIIIYTLYHHIYTLSEHVKKGLQSKGIEVEVFQIPETLSEEVLEKMHAPAKPDIPIITVDKLKEADGFLFGIPTRFGTMPAQVKTFLDATGQLWSAGALAGKFGGIFFSTASQHGGQETTAFTTLTYFAHHGINYVPLGFANAHLSDNTEVVGGSPYGAGTIAGGDGSRQPSEKEISIAVTQGENFGEVLNTFFHVKAPAATVASSATGSANDNAEKAEPKVASPKSAKDSGTVKKSTGNDDVEVKKKCFCM